jgi:hypothetical protein
MEEAVIETQTKWIINNKDTVLSKISCGKFSLLSTSNFESFTSIKREFNFIRNPHHKVRIEGVIFFIDSLWNGQDIKVLVDGITVRTIASDFFIDHHYEICGNGVEHDRLFYYSFEIEHKADILLLEFLVPNYNNQRWGILDEVNLTAIGLCKVNTKRTDLLNCVPDDGYYMRTLVDSPFSGFNKSFTSLAKICPDLCLTCTSDEECDSCILPGLALKGFCTPHSSSNLIYLNLT